MKLTAITLDCPDPPAMAAFYQQATDLDEAEARVLELGAAKPGFQPGGGRWRVLTDPAGHPFCLTLNPPA
jgi:predicted enzyme related to lactoylglutathione lyase